MRLALARVHTPAAAACIAAAGVFAFAAACARPAPPARARRVAVESFRFTPPAIVVAPGDTVVWTNGDLVPHTATAFDSTFSSGSIGAGAEWRWVAAGAGRHEYVCAFHPGMRGSVEVR